MEEKMEPTIPSPTNPAIQQWIAQAISDLANRLRVEEGEIQLMSFEEKIWPDRSLGCPEPGMAYRQVPVDGYLIRLRHGKQLYSYHGGGVRAPFLCEQEFPEDDSIAPPPGFET
jgi:hypothetical protein